DEHSHGSGADPHHPPGTYAAAISTTFEERSTRGCLAGRRVLVRQRIPEVRGVGDFRPDGDFELRYRGPTPSAEATARGVGMLALLQFGNSRHHQVEIGM
ncbi:hypothetical protein ACFQ71_34045, partial [Streptomyces sp. NPDC056534]|uniref:hypothetical protein n=1 Tax=Streptomyces sp. NPDC056534 TaxID=3345857 RepID=UPI00368062A4